MADRLAGEGADILRRRGANALVRASGLILPHGAGRDTSRGEAVGDLHGGRAEKVQDA